MTPATSRGWTSTGPNANPTTPFAAHAFAKKAGVEVSKLEKITTPKGEYLAATVLNKGKSARQVLSELLPKEIASIYQYEATLLGHPLSVSEAEQKSHKHLAALWEV